MAAISGVKIGDESYLFFINDTNELNYYYTKGDPRGRDWDGPYKVTLEGSRDAVSPDAGTPITALAWEENGQQIRIYYVKGRYLKELCSINPTNPAKQHWVRGQLDDKNWPMTRGTGLSSQYNAYVQVFFSDPNNTLGAWTLLSPDGWHRDVIRK